MSDEDVNRFLDWCRYLANTATVDRVIANHARGILVRVATTIGTLPVDSK